VVTFTDSNTVAIDASSAGGTGGAGGGTSSGPVAPSLAEASISPRTGTLTAGDIAEATFREANSQSDLTLTGACKVNAVDVSSSFQNLGGGLYKVAYTVGEGDGERPAGHIPLTCTLGNSAGDMAAHAWTDSNVLSIDTNNDGSIDNGTSTLGFTVVAEPGSGILHVGDALHVSMQDPLPSGDVVVSSNGCRVNGTDVSSSYAYHGDGLYSVDYTVGATDASRDAGTIPFDCGLQNATGSVHLTYFTDGNTVAIDVSTSTPSGEEGGSTGGTGTTTPSTGGDTGGTATSTGSLVTAVGIVPASGTIAAGRTTDVYFNAANGAQDLALGGACRVNDVDVSSSFQNLSGGLYKVTYTVGANDAERAEGMVPISCAFQNGAGATSTVSAFTDNNALAIDTNDDGAITEPTGNDVAFMSSVSAVPNTGTLDAGDSLEVYMQEGNHDAGFTVGACTVNGVDVSSTFVDQGNGLYKVTYTVGAGDADRSAGAIPVDCELHGNGAQSGQTIGTFFGFTDSNTVAINITGGTGTTTPPTGGDTGGNTGGVTTPAILWASITPGSGILHQDDSAQVYFQESHNMTDLSIDGACTVNGVSASLDTLDSGLYRLNYTVGVSDADRTAGAIPVSCFLKNGGGATTTIDSLAENTLAIQVSDSNSTTTGDVGGGVDGGQDAPLAVTSIDQVSGTATAGGGYEHGWAWVFHITVPNAETSLSMKFGDWTHSDGTHAIDAAGNMRISSAQASSSSSVTISAAGDYSEALDLSADLDPHAPGRQIEVRVEMQVPAGAVNGSYATSYGVKSLE
ncbi:MAG TPA: hypothetical protein VFQ72_02740, partial [Candidatus Paceibacterota bacterium]|nr:hypothetical protein [Candidatus Paceibacterota bacterium]